MCSFVFRLNSIMKQGFVGDVVHSSEHMITDHSLVQLGLKPLSPVPPPPVTRRVVLNLDRQVIINSLFFFVLRSVLTVCSLCR